MKTIFKSILSILLLLFIFSCTNENSNFIEESIDYENVFENKIGYVDENTNKTNLINELQLVQYWKNTFDLHPETEFNDVKLIKAQIEEGEEQYYMLNSRSKDGTINISSKIMLTQNGFTMRGEECKCESTNCTFGCEVVSMCQCSTCSSHTGTGECKKTHTVKGIEERMFIK